MIYPEDKPSGVAFPLVVILIAMAAIVGALVTNAGQAASSARVWVPVSTGPSAQVAGIVRPDHRQIASTIVPNN
ncbi:hypothetical protein [Rhizobium sp. BK176]|uniref:hypothetical protein n=1 Tax=Rhizobium sp. BK176 TaxID=2587071 RepID=UPI002168863C|nr:hypothetical protein [Rhizobium sp. BK176]MCS4096659.1 hypothetical protein [Rhizobium sp. BK176]